MLLFKSSIISINTYLNLINLNKSILLVSSIFKNIINFNFIFSYYIFNFISKIFDFNFINMYNFTKVFNKHNINNSITIKTNQLNLININALKINFYSLKNYVLFIKNKKFKLLTKLLFLIKNKLKFDKFTKINYNAKHKINTVYLFIKFNLLKKNYIIKYKNTLNLFKTNFIINKSKRLLFNTDFFNKN
jgi:hypothetical protein